MTQYILNSIWYIWNNYLYYYINFTTGEIIREQLMDGIATVILLTCEASVWLRCAGHCFAVRRISVSRQKEALPLSLWTADKHPPSCLYCKSHYAPQRPPTNLPSTNTSYCDTLIITSCIQPIPNHEYVMPQNESYSHCRHPAVNKYDLSITHCPVKN